MIITLTTVTLQTDSIKEEEGKKRGRKGKTQGITSLSKEKRGDMRRNKDEGTNTIKCKKKI